MSQVLDTAESAAQVEEHDIVIIGAGLSGIDAAYRVQTQNPGKDYVILEGRSALGGTWDLFRYPGVRSDSDMYTLGFPFEPWPGPDAIADGDKILKYLQDTASKYGIDEHIVYNSKVTDAAWDSAEGRWTLEVTGPEGTRTVRTKFVYWSGGYYSYDNPNNPTFPGQESFDGKIVHPQFWPEDLDYQGKKVIIIGSGATAITLAPSMAKRGAEVTMLQRSPSYVITQPGKDPIALSLKKLEGKLGKEKVYNIVRMRYAGMTLGFYEFTRRAPKLATKVLLNQVKAQLAGSGVDMKHFTPRYKPWDQRVCVVPNADLFREIRSGRMSVVTDTIDSIVPEGIRISSGEVLKADIIVTATGLRMQLGGGMTLKVDGQPVDLAERFAYRGAMIEGVPNLAICVGYINSSWTLRADMLAQFFTTFVNHVDNGGYSFGYPVNSGAPMEPLPFMDATSTYIQRDIWDFPKVGARDPWAVKQNFFSERKTLGKKNVTDDMVYVRAGEARKPADDVHTGVTQPESVPA